MNIGLMQVLSGSAPGMSKGGSATVSDGGTFGSILSSMTAGSESTPEAAPLIATGTNLGELPKEALTAIFDATTPEELEIALEELAVLVPEATFLEEGKLEDFKQMDVPALLEQIMPLLEQAGLSESELQAASTITDMWSLLNVLDEVAPKFFEGILQALEGKGDMPKDQAIELLVLLKTVAVQAADTDLTMKQEQQLFSLQGFLQATGERFESSAQPQPNRNHLLQLMETVQPVRVNVQSDTNHGNLKEDAKEQSATNPLTAMKEPAPQSQPTTNSLTAEKASLADVKEPVQQTQSAVNPLTAPRAEASLAELESKQNTRNEALMREMQAVFKRSNFGQTGGTNRLMIQLYPEHLGQVRIELLQVNGVMTARILASTALGKEMLDSQLQQLRHAFVQQNLQVDRIDVSQSLQDAPRNERDNAFNQHFRQEQEEFEESHDDPNEEEQMTFQEYMIELEA